jgi:putative MATE family efflux protein
MDQSFMKTRKILPLVISMSLPMVVSMIVNSLYNIVDSFFVAKISEDAMTALSLVFPIQNLMAAVSIGFGVGANAVTAYFLGAQEKRQADGAASLSLLLSLLHAAILTVVLTLTAKSFLRQFTSDPLILRYGCQYAWIVLGASVVMQVELVYEKLFQAVGKMKVTMIGLSAGCLTNIILDPVMIFGLGPCPRMGIRGAAIATVIGQIVSLVIYLLLWRRGSLPLHLSLKLGWNYRHLWKRLYIIGIPAIFNQALPSLMITALNAILAAIAPVYVLILGVYYKLQTFIYLAANGIIQGVRPVAAYNYGAGEIGRLKKIFKTTLLLTAAVMAVGTLLCILIPQNLIGLFTSSSATIQAGACALRIICLGFIVSTVSVSGCGMLEGMGFGLQSLIISVLRYVAVILPAAFILSRFLGAAGVWNAFWLTELISAIAALFIVKTEMRKVEREAGKAASGEARV